MNNLIRAAKIAETTNKTVIMKPISEGDVISKNKATDRTIVLSSKLFGELNIESKGITAPRDKSSDIPLTSINTANKIS